VDIGTFIDQREGYRGGRPFIVGTGVTVDSIACHYSVHGLGYAELAEEFSLTSAQVMAALAFYLANKDTIDRELEEERVAFNNAADEHRAKHGSVLESIRARAQE
jgi:uncharacterized protein (DUF433 family)